MNSRLIKISLILTSFFFFSSTAHALLISVNGGPSNRGVLPEILSSAPGDVNDDAWTNRAMQAFNEAQGVLLTSPLNVDGPNDIAAGTRVDSHMIFLNSRQNRSIRHFNVKWSFDGQILGVMSDRRGNLEAASSSFLGAPGTLYPPSGFRARGLESRGNGVSRRDGYTILDPYTLRVGMRVTEPGDWIRVVTATPVPEPASLVLFGVGLIGLSLVTSARLKKAKQN